MCNPMHQDTGRAKAVQHLHGHIPTAHRTPGREDEHVGLCQPLYSHLALHLIIVLDHPYRDRHAARLLHQSCDGVRVDVTDLPRSWYGIGCDDFVARRYDSHARPTTHLDLGEAERQQTADVLGSEQTAGWDDDLATAHVLTYLYDILSRRHRPQDLDRRGVDLLRIFYHDHRVCTVCEHTTRIGYSSLAGSQRDVWGLSHTHLARYFQVGWQTLRSAKGITGTHGIPVHS